ncbi:MAG: hypothetical protein V7607_301 [Solirubrobacteraceae bacterium]
MSGGAGAGKLAVTAIPNRSGLMATYLYLLGGWAFQHRWRVVALWATVLVAVVDAAAASAARPTTS